jgi:hypothetical protein
VSAHWAERLSEYLDGELSPAEHASCEAHLAACDTCREILRELGSVVASAQADADQQPTTDLWPGILTRITNDLKGRPSGLPTRIVFTLPQLALAASLLVAVSAGVAYLAGSRASTRPAAVEDPILAASEGLMPPSGTVERANFADAQFDQAVADLERVLIDRRDDLDPRTVRVIERNLAAIDQAIQEARQALDSDPANTFLNSHLADARRKKLDLLRQATMIQPPSGD